MDLMAPLGPMDTMVHHVCNRAGGISGGTIEVLPVEIPSLCTSSFNQIFQAEEHRSSYVIIETCIMVHEFDHQSVD